MVLLKGWRRHLCDGWVQSKLGWVNQPWWSKNHSELLTETKISHLMWQRHLVVKAVPVGIYSCSLGRFLVLVQAGSWCTRCWKACVEIAKALLSPGAWHHPAGTELLLGSSGKASFRWCCILSRQVLNLAFLLCATRKQRFMSQLHDIWHLILILMACKILDLELFLIPWPRNAVLARLQGRI